MKKTKLITGIVCLIIDIIICVAVCVQWAQVGCNGWSLAAAIIFYSIGCYGAYLCVINAVEFFKRLINGEVYPKNNTIR